MTEDVGRGGSNLYAGQPDYAGLATVDRFAPNRLILSTDVDPQSGTALVSRKDGKVHFELWQATRAANTGWRWTPITADSTADNIRPILVGDGRQNVVVWMKGTYKSYLSYSTSIMVRELA